MKKAEETGRLVVGGVSAGFTWWWTTSARSRYGSTAQRMIDVCIMLARGSILSSLLPLLLVAGTGAAVAQVDERKNDSGTYQELVEGLRRSYPDPFRLLLSAAEAAGRLRQFADARGDPDASRARLLAASILEEAGDEA